MRTPALVLVPVLLSLAPAQERRLTADMLLDWETVASPQVSPDGRQLAYTRSWVDKVNDKTENELWLMDLATRRTRPLGPGSSARWSPDGTRLLYLAEGKPRGTQVFVLWVETREATQVTRVDEAPSNPRWSPDGGKIAFTMVVPEKEALSIKLPEKPKDAKWAPDPKVITRLQYRRDQSGYRPAGYRHLFVVESGGGTPFQVTTGDFDHDQAEWLADGTRLVFSGLRAADADWQWRESEIYAVDVQSRAVTQLTRRKGEDQAPLPSPDGAFVAFTGRDFNDDTYDVTKLFRMRADGTELACLTEKLDRDVKDLRWGPGGLWFTVQSEGTRQLWRAGAGGPAQVTKGLQHLVLGSLGAERAFAVRSAPLEPEDLVRIDLATGAHEPLTRVNADLLARVDLGQVEELRCTSKDGLPVQGWLVRPPGFDPAKKHPLILQIHGGPHAMYHVGFDFERQLHAAKGYLLLYTNPRGSTGYGKAFGNAILNAYPDKDYDDLMAAVDAAIAKGSVDEQRLYVYGGSGGGVLTAWIVGHTDRFRAAVSMYPVIDWISFVGTTDGIGWYHNFKKLPWEDITEHWNRSPLKYVGNVTTPTLLITGELDLRTPMSQTEELYQALKLRKVDTAMVRIQDEYHGAGTRHVSNHLRRILWVREWFERHQPGAEHKEPKDAAARER